MLATDTEIETEDDAKARVRPSLSFAMTNGPILSFSVQQKVTLSTCHAAKGLEWPVVFVPACEDGASCLMKSSSDHLLIASRHLPILSLDRDG